MFFAKAGETTALSTYRVFELKHDFNVTQNGISLFLHKSEGCASAVKRILGKIDGAST